MKLSEHLKNGIKIAKENGIAQGKREVFLRDDKGKICQVCALGNVFLSVKGIEAAEKIDHSTQAYNILEDTFPSLCEKANSCLQEKSLPLDSEISDWFCNLLITIFKLNDDGVPPEKIAEVLEECGY